MGGSVTRKTKAEVMKRLMSLKMAEGARSPERQEAFKNYKVKK